MLNLDVRDLEFWHKEAQKKEIRGHVRAIQAVRVGMMEHYSYAKIIEELKMQIRVIDQGKEKIVKNSWTDLKKIGRR